MKILIFNLNIRIRSNVQIIIYFSISKNKTLITTSQIFQISCLFFTHNLSKSKLESSVTNLYLHRILRIRASFFARELVTLIYPSVPQKTNFKGVRWKYRWRPVTDRFEASIQSVEP